VLWYIEDDLSLNIKICLILLIFMEIGGGSGLFGHPLLSRTNQCRQIWSYFHP
jgi:hypothetical protein